MSERGERLNIYKATLREWRRDFARYLRELGVEANATERAVRGSQQQNRKTGIYRAAARGESSFMRERAEAAARELRPGGQQPERGRLRLSATRRDVERGWRALGELLEGEGVHDVAAQVRRFASQMPPVHTDRELIANALRARLREAPGRAPPLTR